MELTPFVEFFAYTLVGALAMLGAMIAYLRLSAAYRTARSRLRRIGRTRVGLVQVRPARRSSGKGRKGARR